jgi:hypothetical protein
VNQKKVEVDQEQVDILRQYEEARLKKQEEEKVDVEKKRDAKKLAF